MKNQDPLPKKKRQDTQAHGKVSQSGDVAQSVVTLAQSSPIRKEEDV
jgi:flagellar biosynthesis protein FlhB